MLRDIQMMTIMIDTRGLFTVFVMKVGYTRVSSFKQVGWKRILRIGSENPPFLFSLQDEERERLILLVKWSNSFPFTRATVPYKV